MFSKWFKITLIDELPFIAWEIQILNLRNLELSEFNFETVVQVSSYTLLSTLNNVFLLLYNDEY